MSPRVFDYSPEAFTAALGPDVMEQIRQSVKAAPVPSPEQVERLRAIFALALADLSQPEPLRDAA